MTAEVEEWQRFKTLNQVAAYSSNIQYIPFFSDKAAAAGAVAQIYSGQRGPMAPSPIYATEGNVWNVC